MRKCLVGRAYPLANRAAIPVVEQHYVAGGLTQTFSCGGFRWDVGAHSGERRRRVIVSGSSVSSGDALNLVPVATASPMGIAGIPFTVEAVYIGRGAAMLGASLTVAGRNSAAVFVACNAELRQHETVRALMGGVRIVW